MSSRTTTDRTHHTTHAKPHDRDGQSTPDDAQARGAIKDPKDWTTGDEPMTGAQQSYLDTLAREAGEQVDGDLTKGEASEKIGELRHKTGRDATPTKQKTLGAGQ